MLLQYEGYKSSNRNFSPKPCVAFLNQALGMFLTNLNQCLAKLRPEACLCHVLFAFVVNIYIFFGPHLMFLVTKYSFLLRGPYWPYFFFSSKGPIKCFQTLLAKLFWIVYLAKWKKHYKKSDYDPLQSHLLGLFWVSFC